MHSLRFLLAFSVASLAHAAEAPPGACAAPTDGRTACPTVLTAKAPASAPAGAYVLVAKEGAPFTRDKAQFVRYGSGTKWVEKGFGAGGPMPCSNATFGTDPIQGTVKRCEARAGSLPDLVSPMVLSRPATLDRSPQDFFIDAALLASVAPVQGHTEPRVRSTWRKPDGTICPPNTAGCGIPGPEVVARSDIGDFREPTAFARFGNFDPIVNADDPTRVSHPHTFMGNTSINPHTTPDNIMGCSSVNYGGTLNCSSYWFPTGVDTRTGNPLVPLEGLVYYKGNYAFDISKSVELMPIGLRVVAGNAANTDPAKASGRFTCFGPKGEQGPTASTVAGALAGNTCKAGGVLQFGIGFPQCWDGINLDSPNHSSHMAWPVADATGTHCPRTHPRVLPTISYSFGYRITDDALVANIRFSSDAPGAPAGTSFHADWYIAWDPDTGQRWIDHCIKKKVDCHAYLLGDGYALY